MSTEIRLADCLHVIEVDGTSALHPIRSVQHHLAWQASDRRGNGGDKDCGDQINRVVPADDHDGPTFVRRREAVKPDATSFYSSGHA